MPVISQDFVKGNIKDMYTYAAEAEAYEKYDPVWQKYIKTKKIDGEFWQRTTFINSGTWRKTAQSEGFVHSGAKEGFTAYGRVFDFCQAIAINKDTVNDHQKLNNLLKDLVGGEDGWQLTARWTEEEFYARLFNKGGVTTGDWIFNGTPESASVTDSSGNYLYDSTCMFNLTGNTRSSKMGGTYYNAVALTLDSTDDFDTLWNLMVSTNNRDERDKVIRIKPDIMVVPTALLLTAKRLLNSTLEPWKTTNTANALQGIVELIENPYIETSTEWILGCKYKGIEALERQAPEYDFFQDKLSRKWWATGEMRMGVLVWNWRFWGGSNVPSS